MSSAALTRLRDEYLARCPTLPESVIGASRRSAAIEALCAQGLPSTREENWRYTNLRLLERARFAPAPEAEHSLPALPAPLPGFARYVFVDGEFRCGADDLPGVSVRTLRTSGSAGEAWEFTAQLPESRLALLNEAFATDAATIDVRRDATTEGIELVFIAASGAQSGACYPRVRLALQSGAQLTVVERHVGAGEGSSLVNSAVRVELAEQAHLRHYRVQECGARAAWFDTLSAELSRDARYELLLVSTAALAARSTVHARLSGPGAELALSAAALGEGQQSLDMYAMSEHLAARTRTQQTFRGIASDRARVAFNGKIVVHEQARGTDSRQSLRGLLAGAQAEIDLRPQLEIYTDEVRCSHGASAGKLDENMLFYLLSRGIAPEVAQHLLKWAFLEDVISRIAPADLRRQIELGLAGQMSEAATLKELL